MPKKAAAKTPIVWKQFVLFWWQEVPGNRLGVYRTRRPEDIEVFGPEHYRVRFHPDSSQDQTCEVILRRREKVWCVKHEDDEECWVYYDDDSENSIWTSIDDTNQELFVIRGELKA